MPATVSALPASISPVSSAVSSAIDVHHLVPSGMGKLRASSLSAMVAPDMTPQAAHKQLDELTAAEHQRISAYLKYGTFKSAAKALNCNQETVSSTWHKYRGLLKALIDERKTV